MDFFTSDLHFGHLNIIKYCNRPFADTDEMDEYLIRAWNETVSATDTVFVLGDVALGSIDKSLSRLGRLQGRKILVSGNHDRCWMYSKRSDEWRERYLNEGFDEIHEEMVYDLAGEEVILSHFPYKGDSHEVERFPAARPEDAGKWLFHGHVHDAFAQRGRQVNVGVDVRNFRPISAEALRVIVAEGPLDR